MKAIVRERRDFDDGRARRQDNSVELGQREREREREREKRPEPSAGFLFAPS